MSTEIQRYEPDELSDVSPSTGGDYVLFSDHQKALAELRHAYQFRGATIEAQNDTLNACRANCDNLKSILDGVSAERDRLKAELEGIATRLINPMPLWEDQL